MSRENRRIESALRELGAEHTPRAGWEQRVLDAAARRSWTRMIITAIAATVVGVLLGIITVAGAGLLTIWLVGL